MSVSDQVKEEDKDFLDLMPIKQRVSALDQRCSSLRKEANDQEKQLERIVNEITTFDTATGQLRDYLGNVHGRIDSLDPIHNDAEVITKQLAEVQVRRMNKIKYLLNLHFKPSVCTRMGLDHRWDQSETSNDYEKEQKALTDVTKYT